MRTAVQIASTADQLANIASRLVAQESLRSDAIQRVKENTRLSDSAKKEELAKLGLEVLTALDAQVKILKADLDSASADWSNLGMVLRAAALPLGGTPAEAQVMAMLRDESAALENDPRALQSAMEAAALERDWMRVHALTLGRLDSNGRPLDRWRDVIPGLRFDCLDLPGQLAVMEALYRGEAAFLAAKAAMSHATGQSDITTTSLIANLPAKLAKAKWDREARVMLTPAEALQRAEDERLTPGDRYERLPDEGGLMVIFDNANGVSRFVDAKTGPAYMAKLNALTRIPTPADGLPLVAPVTADPGTVPEAK